MVCVASPTSDPGGTFLYAFGVVWVVLFTALQLSLLMGRLLDATGAWLRRGWRR